MLQMRRGVAGASHSRRLPFGQVFLPRIGPAAHRAWGRRADPQRSPV